MNRQPEVRPYAWATKEPETPAKGDSTADAGAAEAPGAPASVRGGRRDGLPAGIGADSTHAFVWHHAREAAAVLRALKGRDDPVAHEGKLAGMRPRHLAAAFLCGLGYEVGARVVQELRLDGETDWVTRAVLEEPAVTHGTAMAALDHVRRQIEAGEYLERSGADFAHDLLRRAFGDRANRLLPRDERVPDFTFLREAPPEVAARFIAHEHPQTIALLLSQLDPDLAAALLGQLSERLQADAAYRLATLGRVPAKVLKDLGEGLEASMCLDFGEDVPVGGPEVLARVLDAAAPSVEKNVLDQIDAQDPEVSEATRRPMSPPPTSAG